MGEVGAVAPMLSKFVDIGIHIFWHHFLHVYSFKKGNMFVKNSSFSQKKESKHSWFQILNEAPVVWTKNYANNGELRG